MSRCEGNAPRSVRGPGGPCQPPVAAAAFLAALLAACGGSKASSAPPAPALVVTGNNLVTSESGTVATFQVRLAAAPSSQVEVEITVSDSTEGLVLAPGYATPSSWQSVIFTPSDFNVPRTIEVHGQDDLVQDGNVTYTISVAVGFTTDMAYLQVPAVKVSVTNSDDDTAGLTVSKLTLATAESGTSDTFTVRLNTQPSATVVVPVTSTDTSEGLVMGGNSPATPVSSISLTFTPYDWNVPQTVTVRGQDDFVDDGNQTYTVTVGKPTGAAEYAALLAVPVSVTNSDDDTAGLTVLPEAVPLVTSENGTSATFTVRLNSQPVQDVVLPITSGNPGEGLLSAAGQGPAASVALTFTAANWNVAQTVTVTGQDDLASPVLGDNVSYTVAVGPATGLDPVYPGLPAHPVAVLNTDNDVATFSIPEAAGAPLITSESGTTATFKVQLNKAPASDVVIPVTSGDVTEGLVKGGSSPSIPQQTISLTFTTLDWQTPQVVTVVGQPDVVVDGNQTYSIMVGPPSGDAGYALLPSQTISVTNSDVNVAGYTVSTSAVYHTEAGTPTSFTVRLNTQPLADVVVPVTSGDPGEGLVAGGSSGGTPVTTLDLTFNATNWQTPQVVTVQGQNDNLVDGTQTYAITVGPTSSTDVPYQGLAAKTVTATCYDSNVAGYTVTPVSGLTTSEAGGTATFSVRLDTIPVATVSIPVSVAPVAEALVSAAAVPTPTDFLTLTFTADNWSTPQVVTVHGVDDALLDGAMPFTVTVGPTTSGDTHYNALPAKAVTGTNADDEVGVGQGTSAAPVNLTGLLPYQGQVGTGSSYYRVDGLSGQVLLTLTAVTDDVSLSVYGNANLNSSSLLCSSNAAGAKASESCLATVPASGTVWIVVSGAGTTQGAGFVLDVRRVYSYVATDVPKAIPDYDATGVDSVLTVAGGPATIAKVTVLLNVTHTWDSDLTITLISPSGTPVVLTSGNGGSGDNYTNTLLDDAAVASITTGTAPFTGSYRPQQALSALAGQNPGGTWRLRIVDSYSGDIGTLEGWTLTIW
jgi:subtilisin-like proprotein convertase family protein